LIHFYKRSYHEIKMVTIPIYIADML